MAQIIIETSPEGEVSYKLGLESAAEKNAFYAIYGGRNNEPSIYASSSSGDVIEQRISIIAELISQEVSISESEQ